MINLLKKHFLSVFIGFVVIVYGIVSLFLSEVKHLKTNHSLTEVKHLISLDGSSFDLESINDKVIHCSGQLEIKEPAFDADLNFSQACAMMRRNVKMFQWVELEWKSENSDGDPSSSYSYEQRWDSKVVDSSSFYRRFDHENPKMAIESLTFYAKDTKVCGLILARDLINKMSSFKKINIKQSNKHIISDGDIFIGSNPANPKVGDLRISYTCAGEIIVRSSVNEFRETSETSAMISVIGKVDGDHLGMWSSSLGINLGFVHEGLVTPENMVKREMGDQMINLWLSRFVGFFIHFVGFSFLYAFLNEFGISYSHSLRRAFLSQSPIKINVVVSLGMTVFQIVIVWFFYKPWLIVILFVLVIVTMFVTTRHSLRNY